ncbi:sporulation protein YdcC [Marinithermofilum abyssi]|uniref:Sporulation protein YdcC n=1 Tax=Marinithermofilum abyssi TaxID=1571185 RepID=A0A8J2VD83_9BACL|nr:outer membrane lipoprotein carrier protein LolA [Marinithermofilum abyssi]GGE23868.1 sporulation protein YdcC [Marinithermofilum abyssi]
MRRIAWVLTVVLVMTVGLTGCGEKSPEEVVHDLSKQMEKMKGYKSQGKMVINTGSTPQEYEVEVWYKKPNFYRVSLKNTKKDITQILLRNNDGVFVLTPHLDKSFRFQSDWPENSGQVYLYKTLLNSIIDDPARKMTSKEGIYQFEVAAKYPQNQSLVKQRIWMDSDYRPQKVEVLNDQDQVMVQVQFNRFEGNASFDKDAFDMERNMSYDGHTVPTFVKKPSSKDKEKKLQIRTPGWVPQGSELEGEHAVQTPAGKAVILRYQGKKPFTLSQRQPQAISTSADVYGKPVELGYTVGVLLEMDQGKRLSWIYDGTEFELYGALSENDLTRIARSVYGQEAK